MANSWRNNRYDPMTTVAYTSQAYGMIPNEGHRALSKMHAMMERSECNRRRAIARDVDAIWRNDYEHIVDASLSQMFDEETYREMKLGAAAVSKRQNLLRDVITKKAIAWDGGSTQWLAPREGFDLAKAMARPSVQMALAQMPMDDGTEEARAARKKWFDDALMLDEAGHVESPEFVAVVKDIIDVDNFMKAMDAYTLQHPRMAAMPAFVYDDAIQMRRGVVNVLTPEHFDIRCSRQAPALMTAFIQFYEGSNERGETVEMRRIWERAVFWDEVNKGKDGEEKWEMAEAGKQVNPYGRIPAVLFGAGKPLRCPWLDTDGEMLAEVTVAINKALSYLDLIMLSQVKVLALEMKPGAWPVGQAIGPGRVIAVPPGSEAVQVVDLQSDVAAFREQFIRAPRREACAAVGLAPDEFESVGPESGEAKKMRDWQRIRDSVSRRSFLRESLVELYWLVVQMAWFALRTPGHDGAVVPIYGFERGLTPPYIPGLPIHEQPVTFGVDVNDIVYPELADEKAKREDRMIAQGRTSIVDVYRSENPEVPDEKAAQMQIQKNLRDNRALLAGRAPLQIPVKADEKKEPA